MAIHASLTLTLCTVASLFVGGVAIAQQTGTTPAPSAGTTSAPSAGKHVEPSTVTEKKYESEQQRLEGGPVGGGRPGVEAMPGTEGGKAVESGK